MADGMATANFVGFQSDSELSRAFDESWSGFENSLSGEKKKFPQTLWRAHIVTWCFNQVRNLPGDFVECGNWFGTLMKTACIYHKFEGWDKKLVLADTWEDPYSASRKDIYQDVEKRFEAYKNVILIRGSLPNTLPKILDAVKTISFLALDLNDGPTERFILEKVWPRLDSGAIIYLDDYGCNSFQKLRSEVDEFLKDKSETLLHFPNQVSLVIKK